jgi:hypothetical protein
MQSNLELHCIPDRTRRISTNFFLLNVAFDSGDLVHRKGPALTSRNNQWTVGDTKNSVEPYMDPFIS